MRPCSKNNRVDNFALDLVLCMVRFTFEIWKSLSSYLFKFRSKSHEVSRALLLLCAEIFTSITARRDEIAIWSDMYPNVQLHCIEVIRRLGTSINACTWSSWYYKYSSISAGRCYFWKMPSRTAVRRCTWCCDTILYSDIRLSWKKNTLLIFTQFYKTTARSVRSLLSIRSHILTMWSRNTPPTREVGNALSAPSAHT